ncbi:MAG TPA: hypothetical protein VIX59_05565 [Candidatus Binataceae bacterium]
MYSSAMRANCEKFEQFLATPGLHGALQSIDQYFAAHGDEYTDIKTFVNDFVTPYLSIMNGYGGPDMGQMQVVDLAVIFDLQLAHFTKPGIGWSQFSSGSSSWVQAMAQAAKAALDLQIMTDVTVLSVATNPTTGKVSVAWGSKGPVVVDEFDKVILTTDMWTNANLLGGANNSTYWNQLYSKYLDKPPVPPQGPPPDPKTAKWNLMQGACYIHTDASMLAPSLRPLQQETLQFNAYFAGRPDGSYDIAKTFTTYILKNLLPDDQAQHADGLYLTMYGYIPGPGDKQPAPETTIKVSKNWIHGHWVASFLDGPKQTTHLMQGLGRFSYPGQLNTNVYFAGNNVVIDSEDGALVSAMAIADYAFGIPYPLPALLKHPLEYAAAIAVYTGLYKVMFPGHAPMFV